MITADYDLTPGTVHPCAWCYPGESVAEVFPHLAGWRIHHRICLRHERELASIGERARAILYGATTETKTRV